MANLCYDVVSERVKSLCESTSRAARRRRLHIRRCKFVPDAATAGDKKEQKCQNLENSPEPLSEEAKDAFACGCSDGEKSHKEKEDGGESETELSISEQSPATRTAVGIPSLVGAEVHPKFGVASVCGRRRDMEDAVAVHPSFCRWELQTTELHYFAVYDGHGCSHVAMRCRDRLHELLKEELERGEGSTEWKRAMEGSFFRMDREVDAWNKEEVDTGCRCEIPDSVGSTAVVAVVAPDKIIVANCGDSRAVLCHKGEPAPLSTDHKPDRPDELSRIQAAGGRVLFWEGARVLGVLATSRAIGDNYLKPYVSCKPEITITDRTADDDFLILASDGLWDVVSNDTACDVARSCLQGKMPETPEPTLPYWAETDASFQNSDEACSVASMQLTKLALARRSADNVSVVVIDLKRN